MMMRADHGTSHRRVRRSIGVAIAASLLAAACGSDQAALEPGPDRDGLKVGGVEVEVPGDGIVQTTIAPTSTTAPAVIARTELPDGMTLEADVAYNSASTMDIYTPSGDGPFPVVVLFPGQGAGSVAYGNVAAGVAEAGAVVFVPNWRTSNPPDPIIDSRCAVWTAVGRAAEFDGDADKLVLVGYAFGVSAAVGEAFGGPWTAHDIDTDCEAEPAEAQIGGLVGVIGQYGAFDGLKDAEDAEQAEIYDTFSPFAQIADDADVGSIVTRVVYGRTDEVVAAESSTGFHDYLVEAGVESELVTIAHPSLSLVGAKLPEEGRTLELLGPDDDRAGLEAAVAAINETVALVAG